MQENVIHQTTVDARYYELDQHGFVKPAALLNYLQSAAADHALSLGIGVVDLLKTGRTWVLSRINLKMSHYPRVRDSITIRTWPVSRGTIFCIRDFELFDGAGVPCGAATTSWAVLDTTTRRPVKLDDVLPAYPLNGVRAIDDDFATLPEIECDETLRLPVLRDNLDINRHVNNTVYAGWALEAVPSAIADESTLISLEIGFRAEARYGDTITSCCRPEPTEGDCFLHRIGTVSDGRELARARSRWAVSTESRTGGR